MLFVFACWVVFRSESFAAATDMLAAMAGGGGWSLAVVGVKKTWMIAAAAALVIVGPTSQRLALDRLAPRRWAAVGVALAFVYMVLHVGTVREVEFIYFQF